MARGICADCDEHLFILRIICGTSANDAHFFMMLAGVPQASYSFEIYLREFRKQHAISRNICGISASIIHFCNIFAEVLQAKCSFGICLRKFRKQNAVFEHICGSSANVVQSKKRLKSERAHFVACAWDVWRVVADLLRGNDDENKYVARDLWVDIEP